jgi:DegV family protein with EDD domain
MPTVRIVTDSACDLSEEEADALGIEVVPLTIRFGNEEFVDREQLSTRQFYEKLASHSELPQTAAPAPGAFATAFEKLRGEGATDVVCINLSSALSATMQAAQNGAAAVASDIPVRVLDSRSITGGLGTIVLRAAEAAAGGAGVDDIVAIVEDLSGRQRIYGTLDTLENLKKGGRIGGAKALLGSMLSVRPIIHIVDGAVEEGGKPRTRRRALEALRERLYEAGQVEELAVLHGEAPDIDVFLDMIAPRYPRESIRIGKIGAVIGTHGGPGVIGMCYLT